MRAGGEPVGHVTTGEYGSQMLSLGGVHHLTGGSKKEGRVTCETLLDLCNGKPVELDGRRGRDDSLSRPARRRSSTACMRSACGSAAARRRSACSPSNGTARSTRWSWSTTTSPASCPSTRPASSSASADTGIKMRGRRSTPGRYFQVAEPGTGWGGTDIADPLSILGPFDPKVARPGLTLLMVVDHRRASRLLRARRGAAPGRDASCRRRSRCRSSASARTASRRSRRSCSWAGPAARCAPASPRTRSA